jgi:hypothetical protein
MVMDARSALRRWLPEALPSLRGRAWWPFMAIWTATLALALTATVMILPTLYKTVTAPAPVPAMIGLTIDYDAPWLTLGPPVGPEAVRSGLRWGDRLVAIDGRPAEATEDALYRQLAGLVGATVTVTTLSPTGARTRHTLTRTPDHFRQALGAAGLSPIWFNGLRTTSFCIDTVLFLACAIVLMARRSRDSLAPWASLMMLSMVLGLDYTGEWFANLFANPSLAYDFANGIAFVLLIIVLAVFPTGRFEPRWSLAVAVFGSLAAIASTPLPAEVSNAVFVLAQLAAVAAIAARYRAMTPGPGRQQIRWALFGFAASLVAIAALIALQVARARAEDFGLYAWLSLGAAFVGPLIFLLLILGITVSLLRYRLYDADATISRTVAYSLLTVSLLAVFAGSEKVIEIMGEQYLGERLGALAGGLGAALAAVMIVPIHHRVTHWAEHRFRSGLTHLRHGLPLLVGDLRETATPRALADAMLARVERGVRASHGAVVVGGAILDTRDIGSDAVAAWLAEEALPAETAHDLVCDRADPLFPMRVPLQADGVGLVGWLLLGPRPDGSFYGREERAALRDIADPVARALAIAVERERREAARQHRDDSLHRSVDTLRKRFNTLRAFMLERYGFDVDAGFGPDLTARSSRLASHSGFPPSRE